MVGVNEAKMKKTLMILLLTIFSIGIVGSTACGGGGGGCSEDEEKK